VLVLAAGFWGLEQVVEQPPAARPPSVAVVTPPVVPIAEPPAPPPEPHPEPVKAKRPLPVKRTGVVSLNAVPWAAVSIDGRALGNTPLKALEVVEGPHRLTLVHAPQGLTRDLNFEVTGGVRQTFFVDLRRGTIDKRVEPE